ncbi:porin [Burkholderiaceae bacterium DAT-1]|nr:porin [Burkholderiaceae bacterium DAT-1]
MLAALSLTGLGQVWADEAAGEPSKLSISGFGTFAFTKTNAEDTSFMRMNNQANRADSSWDIRNDSLLGVQANYTFNPQWKAVVQLLSHENSHNNFQPALDWAYLAWQPMPALTVRAGRFIVPAFMVSDFRNVDFANPWVRPPTNVYNMATINNIDGIDAVYRGSFGPTTFAVQPYYGRYDLAFPGGTLIRFNRMAGVNMTFEYESLSVRLGYMNGVHTIINPNGTIMTDFRDLINTPVAPDGATFNQVYPGYADIANQLDRDHKPFDLTGLGFIYDNGDLLAEGEYIWRRTSSQLANATGWYLTGGWHIGSWMPYVTLSATKSSELDFNLNPLSQYSALGPLNANNLVGPGSKQKAIAVGVRYDLTKSVSLKAQYDRFTPQDDANGPTSGQALRTKGLAQPLSYYGRSIGVTTLAVNFVF